MGKRVAALSLSVILLVWFVSVALVQGQGATIQAAPADSNILSAPAQDPAATATAVGPMALPTPRIIVRPDDVEVGVNVTDLAWSRDGKWLGWTRTDWSTSEQKTIFPGPALFNATTNQIARTFEDNATSIAFSPDNSMFAVGGVDGELWMRSVEGGQVQSTFPKAPGKITTLAFSEDGTRIAAGTEGSYQGGMGSVVMWDARTGEQFGVAPSYAAVTRLVFKPGSHSVYFSTNVNSCSRGGGGVWVWDGKAKEPELSIDTRGNSVTDMAVQPNGMRLATVGTKGNLCEGAAAITVWDAIYRKPDRVISLTNPFGSLPNSAESVAFTPDSRYLVAGDEVGAVTLWDAATGKQVFYFSARDSSPNSRVAGSLNGTVALYNRDGYIRLFQPK